MIALGDWVGTVVIARSHVMPTKKLNLNDDISNGAVSALLRVLTWPCRSVSRTKTDALCFCADEVKSYCLAKTILTTSLRIRPAGYRIRVRGRQAVAGHKRKVPKRI